MNYVCGFPRSKRHTARAAVFVSDVCAGVFMYICGSMCLCALFVSYCVTLYGALCCVRCCDWLRVLVCLMCCVAVVMYSVMLCDLLVFVWFVLCANG